MKLGVSRVNFFFTDEIELDCFTTHNSQKKNGVYNPPSGDSKQMSIDSFQKYMKEKVKRSNNIEEATEMMFKGGIKKLSLNDFNLQKTLGKGGFGKVYLVEKKDTKDLYALKTIKKSFVIDHNQLEQVKREREILYQASHPFLIGLKSAFQTPDKLFLLMPFIQGGDLYLHLKRKKGYNEDEVRFFIAQISEALGFLHSKAIVYQDLKPENVLLKKNGYVKLADFGASKYLSQTKKYNKYVGTPSYIAPEVLMKKPYDKDVDWWSMGILMYELLFNKPPFNSRQNKELFRKILTKDIIFPNWKEISKECKNIILMFLDKDSSKRLGHKNDFMEVRKHPFFKSIDFEKLLKMELEPIFTPNIEGEDDTNNFFPKYTTQRPKMTLLTKEMVEKCKRYDEMFEGFYYDDLLDKDFKLVEDDTKNEETKEKETNTEIQYKSANDVNVKELSSKNNKSEELTR